MRSTKSITRLARFAETNFATLCAAAGALCHESQEDENGWDCLVEFPVAGATGPAFVQVKSSRNSRPSCSVKLSNAEVLHIGDHDPSGAHMFIALAEDVEAFARELGGSVSFIRLAVTPQQIADLALETQVKKVSDNRVFGSRTTRTCQAEAIAPDILAQIVRDAIVSRIDHKALRRVLVRERRVRRELNRKLEAAT